MNCEQSENLILESMDLVLDAERQSALSAHLAGCVGCSGFLAGQQALDQQFSRSLSSITPSATLRQKVLQSIELEAAPFDKAARIAEAEAIYRKQQVALKRAFLARPQFWMKAAFGGFGAGVVGYAVGFMILATVFSALSVYLTRNPEFNMALAATILGGAILFALARYTPYAQFLRRI